MSFLVQFAKIIPLSIVYWIVQAPLLVKVQNDPAIDRSAQHLVFLGSALLSLVIVVIIGIFSSRTEHAILAAIFLSLVLIGLFFTLGY